MKKLLTVLLALFMVLSLAGCGSKKEAPAGEDVKATQNVNIRQAMAYAIDRASLAKSLNDGSVPAKGMIPEEFAPNSETGHKFRDDAEVVSTYDFEAAKDYFAKGCEELGVKSVKISLLYGTNEGDSVIKAAEQIAYYLEEVGFEVSLNGKQKKERLQLMKEGDYDISLTRWGPDYDDPQTYMDLFVSDNYSNNSGRYSSAEYDALVAKAESTTDVAERWQAFIDAEKILVQQDAGDIPVFQAGGAMLMRPGVSGIEFHSGAVDNYRNIVGKDVVTIASATDIIDLDTCVATDGTSFIASTMFTSGLTVLNADGTVSPDLATWTENDDKTVYTFTIRDDAFWENGTPVTSADFVYAWDRLLSEELASEYAFMIETCNIIGYEAVDEKTFVVTLDKANPFFLSQCAFPVMFPINQEFCESTGDQFATSPDTVLANGPYKLAEWTQGTQYSFVKNDSYWNAAAYADAPAKIVFRVLEDTQTALMEYQTGNIDVVSLSGEQVTANESDPGFQTRLQGYMFYISININHEKGVIGAGN